MVPEAHEPTKRARFSAFSSVLSSAGVGRRLVLLFLALVGGFGFVVPGSALATTGHKFADQFGGLGSGDGQFNEGPGSGLGVPLAVMPSTGEVFTAEGRVQRFDAAGVFQSKFEIGEPYSWPTAVAVDPAGFGSVYVLANRYDPEDLETPHVGVMVKYSPSGVFEYEADAAGSGTTLNSVFFGGSMALAVDPVDGTVYATATDSSGLQVIDRFDGTTGAFIDSFDGTNGSPDGTGFQCPTGLAVDSSHRVYVLDSCKNRVDRYAADGAFGATVYDGSAPAPDGSSRGPTAVAVAPVSDEVYVAASAPAEIGSQILHYTAGGADPINIFDSNPNGVKAMAVSSVGTVYTSDLTNPFVQRYTSFDGPTVVTGNPPSSVEARSAVLEGTIDPEGIDSTYHFEYGSSLTYGSRTPESAPVSGSDPVAASAEITGLQPNKTYHYRIVGTNASGSIAGSDQTFTTATAPPDVGSSGFATAIMPRTVRVHGTVNPNNNSVMRWYVEYGTTEAYGSTASAPLLEDFIFGGGGSDLPVALPLSGLEPATAYHFRVVAVDDPFGAAAPQFGADQTFITSPAAGGGASGVTTRRATLTGTINPHGQDTTYHFNYGPTTAYGATTPEVDAGAGNGEQQVSQAISGLSPDTTYHVQVVATSDDGVTRYGGDGLFRTAPAPGAVAISPIGVSTDAATLVGKANTHGLPGTYRFDVSSLDSSYSFSTSEQPLSGLASAEQVSVPVDGLPAGETFVAQLRVTSNDSTQSSDLVTFKTATVPQVFPPPPAGDGKSSYGCTAPRVDSYNNRPKPGETITINGHDLGASGSVMLGDRSLVPADWSTTGFKLRIPDDATGTLGLTVNCGQRSNTVAIAIFKKPSSRFSIANTTVNGSRATLSVKVAGPGKLTSKAAKAKPGKVTVKKARGAKLVVKLNRAGVRALRKSKTGRLKVPVRVRYLPAGGESATRTVTVTFKHAAGR